MAAVDPELIALLPKGFQVFPIVLFNMKFPVLMMQLLNP